MYTHACPTGRVYATVHPLTSAELRDLYSADRCGEAVALRYLRAGALPLMPHAPHRPGRRVSWLPVRRRRG